MGKGVLLMIAAVVTLLLLVLSKAKAQSLPGCQADCMGIHIDYPFGIGPRCFLPGFELDCRRDSSDAPGGPYLTSDNDPVMNISVSTNKVRVGTRTSRICDSSASNWWLNLVSSPFTISDEDNVFTVIGCNTLALIRGNLRGGSGASYTVGCLSTCDNVDKDEQVKDGKCDGIGCCQASITTGLKRYYTTLMEINNNTVSNISDTNELCGYAFLVEKTNYTFNRGDLAWKDNRFFPVVLDWAIGNGTCEEARSNLTSYACKSKNSVCLDSTTGQGYTCNCMEGYQGNPYLKGGCQDIDECKDSVTYPCNGICENNEGNYSCTCRPGSSTRDSRDPKLHHCYPDPKSTNSKALGIPVGIGIGFGLLLLIGSCTLFYKRSQKLKAKKLRERYFRHNHDLLIQQHLISSSESSDVADKIKFFRLKEVEKATNSFDSSRVVGHGGHGTVYKGLIDLRVVAIKKSNVSIQIEIEQFLNEIILLSQISHRNVVKLIGCCLETEVPLLVYEFVSNGTLSDHLHVWHRNCPLSWDDRLRIATEISRALAYLHSAANVSIFHRDIKSSNILLDENLTAKVSDFGASRSVTFDQTHISTNIQGTFGYLDPEYMHTGQLTEKSDVYSLGVILVELLTGQSPYSKTKAQDERNLTSHFVCAVKDNRLSQIVEAVVLKEADREEVETMANLTMACLSFRGEERPTMKEVEVTLDGLRKDKEKNKKNKRKHDFQNNDEVEGLLDGRSTLYENGSTTASRSTTSLEGSMLPSRNLFR